MSKPELKKPFVPVDTSSAALDLTKTAEPSAGASGTDPEPKIHNERTRDHRPRHRDAPSLYVDALEDAERLLKYAAEVGIEIDPQVRKNVLEARAVEVTEWTQITVANLLDSLTKLAARVKPVTAESLRAASNRDSRSTVRTYWAVAICLAIIIIPFSVATFVTSAISDAIRKDIVSANELAIKLGQLPPAGVLASARPNDANPAGGDIQLPAGLSRNDVITELQIFAATIRAIDTRARELNWFIVGGVKDPFASIRSDADATKQRFQLPIPLTNLSKAAEERILAYQDVRSFGQGTIDEVSVFYGAILTCILPVLYALLGTCAYLLRSYEQEMTNRTFVASHADFPRFMIAAIAGAVVGLFNNFTISQEASIPPLAIAFLVGYAVDVFFSFLEGMIQTFVKKGPVTAKG
jgi:hypothetical protein